MGISITVEDLDADILERLHVESLRRGVDVSAFIRQLIRDGVGPSVASDPTETHHDLDALAGTWASEEAKAFLSATADFRKCDEDLWK